MGTAVVLVLATLVVSGADAAKRGQTCFGKTATIVRGGGNGGKGDDFLDGRRGVDDTLIGGSGKDLMLGGGVLKGGSGPDEINSYSYESEVEVDLVLGGSGNDFLIGDGRNGFGERLLGGVGNDQIVGGKSDDKLDGGSGKDELNGKGGEDKLDGGPQTDRCRDQAEDTLTNCEQPLR